MLIDRAREVGEVPELPRGRGELPQPVVAQPEQLADRGHVGIRLAQRTQDPHRVALVAGVERLGCALELLQRPRAAPRPATRLQLDTGFGGANRAAASCCVLFRARCFCPLTDGPDWPLLPRTRRSDGRSFGAAASGAAPRVR